MMLVVGTASSRVTAAAAPTAAASSSDKWLKTSTTNGDNRLVMDNGNGRGNTSVSSFVIMALLIGILLHFLFNVSTGL